MAGITLEHAEAQLAKYLAAEEAVLAGQSYRIDFGNSSRQVTRADLQFIQQGIETWNRRCQTLSRPHGLMVREVIPR